MKLEDSIHSNPIVLPNRTSAERDDLLVNVIIGAVVVLALAAYGALWFFATAGRDAIPDVWKIVIDLGYLFGTFAVGLAIAYGLWRVVKSLAMWLYGLGSSRQQFWARWGLGIPALVLSGWAVWVWVVPAAMFLVGQVLTIVGFVAGFIFLMWAIHALQLPAPDTEVILVEVKRR